MFTYPGVWIGICQENDQWVRCPFHVFLHDFSYGHWISVSSCNVHVHCYEVCLSVCVICNWLRYPELHGFQAAVVSILFQWMVLSSARPIVYPCSSNQTAPAQPIVYPCSSKQTAPAPTKVYPCFVQ